MDRIDGNLPAIIPLSKAISLKQELPADTSAKRKDEFTILENRREIKPQTHYEKGIFVDIYA